MVFTSILEIIDGFLNYFSDLFRIHSRSVIVRLQYCELSQKTTKVVMICGVISEKHGKIY